MWAYIYIYLYIYINISTYTAMTVVDRFSSINSSDFGLSSLGQFLKRQLTLSLLFHLYTFVAIPALMGRGHNFTRKNNI